MFDIDNILTHEKTHENILIYFAKIKVDSYDSLPIEKIFTLHNDIKHIKSVLNKDKITAAIRYF